jgi:hypothetical protein
MELSAANVSRVVSLSLFDEGADHSNAVLVDGIVTQFGFDPVKLESHRADVASMLWQLPVEFRKTEGGGWSFLNAPMDINGNQWGEQRDAEALMCLGIGLGLAETLMPRDMWSLFPGGVPYFAVWQ